MELHDKHLFKEEIIKLNEHNLKLAEKLYRTVHSEEPLGCSNDRKIKKGIVDDLKPTEMILDVNGVI
ncbi:MAG: hypothetical protein M0C28_20625 [Candidatus Moduliflexus flocculans]|nr:hypothetical protein [Candidatus Moduliflexus flocculans]